VLGPYVDLGFPLVRNSSVGYIDPTFHLDTATGKRFLFWKEDGNGLNPPESHPPLWSIQLSDDGLSLNQNISEKRMILNNDIESWEGPLVEAPWIIKPSNSKYFYLFYSANRVATELYAVGVARSSNILGPYQKYQGNPILKTNNHFSGPGHCTVMTNNGTYLMIYHSWAGDHIDNGNPRLLMMDGIIWTNDEWPIIRNKSPSYLPIPVPGS